MIDINTYEKKWYMINPKINNFIRDIIQAIPEVHNQKISILLTNDQHIQQLNHKYRNKNKPTNVLSFPYEDFADGTIGDVILSLETIIAESKDANISVQEHIAHMTIHGILHLLGYDHQEESEALVMEDLEDKIMQQLQDAKLF